MIKVCSIILYISISKLSDLDPQESLNTKIVQDYYAQLQNSTHSLTSSNSNNPSAPIPDSSLPGFSSEAAMNNNPQPQMQSPDEQQLQMQPDQPALQSSMDPMESAPLQSANMPSSEAQGLLATQAPQSAVAE